VDQKSSVVPVTAKPPISTRCKVTVARPWLIQYGQSPSLAFFALDQFRDQPVGFFARALPHLEEVHQRVGVALLLPSSSRGSRKPCGTTVGALARAHAFSSAAVNT